MRLTINRTDNVVHVDGEARGVPCAAVPANVSVIQWADDAEGGAGGWIEFVNDGYRAFQPNERIVDLTPYASLIDAWHAASKPVTAPGPVLKL